MNNVTTINSSSNMFESLDAIMSLDVTELAELPSNFRPAGVYLSTFESKVNNDGDGLVFSFKVQEVIELVNEEDAAKCHDEMRITYFANLATKDGERNPFGEGLIRMIASALQETYGGTNVGEILNNAQGAEVVITNKHRRNANNPDEPYNDLAKIEVSQR